MHYWHARWVDTKPNISLGTPNKPPTIFYITVSGTASFCKKFAISSVYIWPVPNKKKKIWTWPLSVVPLPHSRSHIYYIQLPARCLYYANNTNAEYISLIIATLCLSPLSTGDHFNNASLSLTLSVSSEWELQVCEGERVVNEMKKTRIPLNLTKFTELCMRAWHAIPTGLVNIVSDLRTLKELTTVFTELFIHTYMHHWPLLTHNTLHTHTDARYICSTVFTWGLPRLFTFLGGTAILGSICRNITTHLYTSQPHTHTLTLTTSHTHTRNKSLHSLPFIGNTREPAIYKGSYTTLPFTAPFYRDGLAFSPLVVSTYTDRSSYESITNCLLVKIEIITDTL